jgi:hypothetical protein
MFDKIKELNITHLVMSLFSSDVGEEGGVESTKKDVDEWDHC